jgi:Mg-chelatase subunit ChlD
MKKEPPDAHRSHTFASRSIVCAGLAAIIAFSAALPVSANKPFSPQADLPTPANIKCQGWENNTVVVSWDDEAPDETEWRVERNVAGGAWSQVATLAANSTEWRDTGISNPGTVERRYRVRSFRSGDSANSPFSAICSNRRIYENGPFRIFYGLRATADDCPQIGTKDVCTGSLDFVDLQGQSLQGSRSGFQRVGFALDAGVPPGSLDKIPINVVWCDGGGCAGGGGLGLSPELIETAFDRATRVGDPVAYIVAEHELFHFLQGRYGGLNEPNDRWVIEGQARSSQDKICLGADRPTAWCFDDIDTGYAGYVGEVNGYLGNPNVGIRVASYSAALFWTYLTEKYGNNLPSDTVEGGMNLMVKFWEDSNASPGRDAVTVLNSALNTMGYPSSVNFKSIFKDFVIANVAKDLNGAGVPAKYKYTDMSQPGGTYAPVMYTLSQTLPLNGSFLDTDETVNPWGARYYQVRPAADVPVIPIKISQDTLTPLFYTVLGIKNDTVAYEQRYEQRNLDITLLNDAYDRVVVVVAGLDNLGNYRIALNGTQPQLRILSPTTANKARVGDKAAPEKFLTQLEVVAGDGTPLAGVTLDQFAFQIGASPVPASNIVASSTIQGQQWFVIQAVTQGPGPSLYDLTVRYSTILTGTQPQAIDYTPRTDADNVLVIDRSGSMADFGKMTSAQQASRLYIDSWRAGDKIGVESFSDSSTINMQLKNWTTDPPPAPIGSREEAFDAIGALAPAGGTAIGDGLLAGWDELKARGNNTHDWALILLSDGLETAGTKTFDDAINAIYNATEKKPVVHTVAIGPDADRPRMQNAANALGGTYQYVSAPASGALVAASADGMTPDAVTLSDVDMMPLNIDSKYRAIAAYVIGHQQFFSKFGPATLDSPETTDMLVDGNVSEMVISLSWLPTLAFAALHDPDGVVIAPAQTDTRHQVWRVPTPKKGVWKMTVRGTNQTNSPGKLPPYYLQGQLKSLLTLNAFIDTPIPERKQGNPIHIVALLTDDKPLTGATVTAAVTKPNNLTTNVVLHDDGLHGDGAPNDGVYGNSFFQTGFAGSYNVLVKASGVSPLKGAYTREALLSFHLAGDNNDKDKDRLLDGWEDMFPCLSSKVYNDPQGDADKDGLPNYQEWQAGTNPCNPDTDGDGEADGTDREPTDANPGRIEPPWSVAWPGINKAWLKYVVRKNYKRIEIYRRNSPFVVNTTQTVKPAATDAEDQLIGVDEPPTGVFTDTTAVNGASYCYYAVAIDDAGQRSTALSPTCTTPKADPAAPHGGIKINNGARATFTPNVTLNLIASDAIDPHTDSDFGAAFMQPPDISASGVADMMISERSDMQGGAWEPYAPAKPWTLGQSSGLASVFVKYRDKAGNESEVYAATIHVGANSPGIAKVSLPVVLR